MTLSPHLWAVGFDEPGRAERVRAEVVRLRGPQQYLFVHDTIVVVRHTDGSLTINREPFSRVGNVLGTSTLGFLAGLIVGLPFTGAAIGAVVGAGGSVLSATVGIDEDFIREVSAMLKPGTSALFVLDDDGDMEVTIAAIRGLGGTVLRTNVDVERAKLIQSTLLADAPTTAEQASAMRRTD